MAERYDAGGDRCGTRGRGVRRRPRRWWHGEGSRSWSASLVAGRVLVLGRASRRRRSCGRARAVEAADEVEGAAQAVTGGIDVEKALAYRDFMVSDYDDAGQVQVARTTRASGLYRGSARLDGRGQGRRRRRRAGDEPRRARHGPRRRSSRPVEGLRELEGVLDQPRGDRASRPCRAASSCSAAGRSAARWRQALRRFGAEVAIVEGGGSPPVPRGQAGRRRARRGASRGGDRRPPVGARDARRARDGGRVRADARGRRRAARRESCSSAPAAPRARARHRARGRPTSSFTGKGVVVDEHLARGPTGIWAIGDTTRHRPVHARRQVPGARRGRATSSPATRGARTTARFRAVTFTDPEVAAVGGRGGRADGDGPARRGGSAHVDLHARVRQPAGLPDARLGRAEADGPPTRSGRRRGEWLGQATLRDPRRGPARGPARHDPAVPDLLRGPTSTRADRPSARRPSRRGAQERVDLAPARASASGPARLLSASRLANVASWIASSVCLPTRAAAPLAHDPRAGAGRARRTARPPKGRARRVGAVVEARRRGRPRNHVSMPASAARADRGRGPRRT